MLKVADADCKAYKKKTFLFAGRPRKSKLNIELGGQGGQTTILRRRGKGTFFSETPEPKNAIYQ